MEILRRQSNLWSTLLRDISGLQVANDCGAASPAVAMTHAAGCAVRFSSSRVSVIISCACSTEAHEIRHDGLRNILV